MNPVYKSFNGGEVSPLMAGRLDLEKYHDACLTLENAICVVQGPAVRRGGFRFIAETKNSAKACRLIPFDAAADAAYVIEAGEEYFRFFRGLSRIESAGIPVEVVTAFLESELFDFHYAQSVDLLYLVHEAHAPTRLSRLADDGTQWTYQEVRYSPPPLYEQDSDYSGGTISISPDAVTGAGVKVRSSADLFLAADKDRILKYLGGRASITAVGSAREATVEFLDDFPAAVAPEAGSGNVTTVGTAASFLSPHGLAVGNWVRLTSGAQSGEKKRVVGVVDATHATLESAFSADQAGTSWSRDKEAPAGSWTMDGSPVATLTPTVASPVGAIATLNLSAAGWRPADVSAGKYVKVNTGIVRLTAYSSGSAVSGQIVKALSGTSAAAGGAWSAEVPAWNAADGYPAAICFNKGRQVTGGSPRHPNTLWFSQTDDYENHGTGTNAADAFSLQLTGIGRNQVRWLMPAKALLGGTSAGEFSITSGSDAALTPTNPDPLPETTHGSRSVRPVKVGHLVLFVQAQGRKVREISYDYRSDNYVAPDLTRLAEHITEGGIVDMAYQEENESILWCVRSDGVLLGLTYNREEEVWAWHRHVTDGYFESVAVIPDPANQRDQLWAVVRRTIGGATRRYIEVLDPDLPHADSFVRYSGDPVSEIYGLSHLEGKSVDVVADGFVIPGKAVAGGMISLPAPASEVVVGLHYDTTVTPTRPDYVDDRGRTTIGKKKQWTEIILRLKDTGLSGVTVNGKPIPARAGSDPLGSAPALFTGDATWPANLGTDADGILTVKQTLPLPFTLVAITGTLDVGD